MLLVKGSSETNLFRYFLTMFFGVHKLSVASVLTNSPKVLLITKTRFFQFNFVHSDQQISCGADLNSVSDRLPCCLSKSLLKRKFLDICLTTFFGFLNSENIEALRNIFSSKCSKFDLDIKNAEIN